MSQVLVPIAIIGILILINGLFVAAEFSIVAVPVTRLAQLAEEGSKRAQSVISVIRNRDRQYRYIATAQVGITIASLMLGMYGEGVVADWFGRAFERLGGLAEPLVETLAVIFAVGILTYLHVVLGEMVPKSLALQAAEPTVLRLDGPMRWSGWLFRPLVVFLNGLGNRIVHLLGIPPLDASERLYSPEELELIVDESFEGGLLESSEQLYIENIFDLHERTVGQVMTPRTRIVGIPVTASLDSAIRRLCETRQTRYPLYDGNLDQIVGTLHVKDIARLMIQGGDAPELGSLARPAVFIPESLTVEKVLLRFRREGLQMAIVIDEYGGTAGLATLEDLIEEVVGEIQDEFDQEIVPFEVLAPRVLRVRGDLILDELTQHFDLSLELPEVDTVGGLVMSILRRIPRTGDSVEYGGIKFTVETVRGLAVQTVIVRLPALPNDEQLIP
jgi:magnesium and cobalt exporter, CNNM family